MKFAQISIVLMLLLATKLSSSSDCDESGSKTAPETTTLAPVTVHNEAVCVESNSGSVTTVQPPTSLNSTIQNLVSLNDCISADDNTLMTDSRHCRRYYICQNGRVKRLVCSLTQWFDRSTGTCRDRSLVTNCPVNRT